MKQLFIVIFVGIVSLISLSIIAFSFDPFQSVGYVKFLFYASLFTAIWGGGTILFFYLRRDGENRFGDAFRMGFLLSIVTLVIFLGLRLR